MIGKYKCEDCDYVCDPQSELVCGAKEGTHILEFNNMFKCPRCRGNMLEDIFDRISRADTMLIMASAKFCEQHGDQYEETGVRIYHDPYYDQDGWPAYKIYYKESR